MIGGAVDRFNATMEFFFGLCTQMIEQFFFERRQDDRGGIFRPKNHMDPNFNEGM
jgi:hypothetical protein